MCSCSVLNKENEELKKENELLKEYIKELETDINRLYYTMISLKAIDNEEIEEI